MKSLNRSISSDQRTLYEDILLPKGEQELVQTTIEAIHTLIDPSFSEDIFHGCYEYRDSPLPQYSTMDPRQYPRGYCHIICGRVYTILKEHPIIREFQAKGGLFEHDYVVYQDRESPDIVGFTNVIRIGHKILDPNIREFHPDRPHPSLQDQDDSAYQQINYANFVDTAEKYWGSQLYSSIEILGPGLAQFFPFVDIDPSGMLAGFPIIHSDRIKESILNEGKEIQEFFQSDNNGVRIPDNQMIERFQEVFRCIQIHNGECIGHEEIDQDFLRLFQKFIDRRLEVVGEYNLQDVLKNGWGNQTMTPTERDKFLDYLLLYVHDEFFPIIIKTYNQLLE